MQYDSRDHHLYSRMHMPPRMPTQSPSPGRRGPSTSRSTSPSPTSLTLRNTFDEDCDFHTVLDPITLNARVSDLGDELLDHVEPAEMAGQEGDCGTESTISKPFLETAPSRIKDLTTLKADERGGSNSGSVLPPKNALAPDPRPATKYGPHDHSSRRAHFDDDDVLTSDVLVRRPMTGILLKRRKTEPAKVSTSAVIVDERLPHLCQNEDEEDCEVTAAIGMFEEVIEELIQPSQEHEEAKEQLAAVARQVTEAMLDSEEVDYEGDDENGSPDISQDTEYGTDDRHGLIVNARCIGQSIADKDADQTCIEGEDVAIGNLTDEPVERTAENWSDEEHRQPEVLFLTNVEAPKKLDLQSIKKDPAAESSSSSTDTVIGPSIGRPDTSLRRRVSESHAHGIFALKSEVGQRSASISDFAKLQGKLKSLNTFPKANPAGCAVTSCSVHTAESPTLNNVYMHTGARIRQSSADKNATRMTQTVRSDSGVFQILWDERPSTSSSCVTLFSESDFEAKPATNESYGTLSNSHIQMDKVKTKLAAWSWAREHSLLDKDGNPKWLPLLSFEMHESQRPSSTHTPRSEGPLSPPNTERPSGASSGKHSGVSSGKHSATRSPPGEHEIQTEDDDEDGDEPIELKVKAALSRPPNGKLQDLPSDYLDVPVPQFRSMPSLGGFKYTKAISRQLSDHGTEHEHFMNHRDSLVLLRKREREEEIMNQQLLNSQDSMILTRFKFETRYPNLGVPTRPGWSHIRELSPIPDASPPRSRRHSGGRMNVGDKSVRQSDAKPRECDGASG